MTDAARDLLQQGMALHKAGKLDEAKNIYQKILEGNPKHPDSLHLLGLIELDKRQFEVAENLVRKAVAEQDNFHIFHNTLGNIFKAQKKYTDAVISYERALSIKPDFYEPLNNLGASLLSLGKLEEAQKYFQQAITVNPQNANAIHNMATTLEKQKKYEEAIQYYQRLLVLKPAAADVYLSLGNLFYLTKNSEEAKKCYQKILELKPDDTEMLSRLGRIYLEQAQFEKAMKYYSRLLSIRPDAYSYANIAITFQGAGQFEQAIAYHKKALEIQPDIFHCLNDLAIIYKSMGQLKKSIHYLKAAIDVAPDNHTLRNNLLGTMIYTGFVLPEEIAHVARKFGEHIANPLLRQRLLLNKKNHKRKLRIGYVSPDFRSHSVSFFIEPLLKMHNRKDFEVFAYAYLNKEDQVTERLRKQVDHWRDIRFMNADTAADLIEKDQIDILVDLAGHTAYNSLLVFAHKPAPIQLTWLGWPATTGIKAMDYRITDVYAEPDGMTEHLNTETLWRLPEIFCCYQPHENSPAVIDHSPFEDNGYITFGCFNNFSKITDDVLKIWSQIMAQVPEARLMLEIAEINEPILRTDVEERMHHAGIPLQRVILEPRKPSNQYILYNKIDIALDPFPCVGGTTSMDTLWMGVPFVTLAGRHFASRMGVSILTNAGMPELIAQNTDEYIDIAVKLANDKERLKKLRHGLRERVQASPLMDQERFTRNMEAAYRAMWQKYCTEN
jgi:protein O-GlcNAc transferase